MRTKGAKKGVKGNSINKEQFETLCKMMCSEEEIASFFNVSVKTLIAFCKQNYNDTFLHTFNRFKDHGKITLRRLQFKHAEKNPTMAIWLGKQYLGQSEKIDTRVFETEDDPITQAIKESLNVED